MGRWLRVWLVPLLAAAAAVALAAMQWRAGRIWSPVVLLLVAALLVALAPTAARRRAARDARHARHA